MSAMDYFGGQPTVRRVGQWTRHDVAATPETIVRMLTEAYMSCTFGNYEPVLIRMGTGFHDTLVSRVNVSIEATNEARRGAYQGEQYVTSRVLDVDEQPLRPVARLETFMGAIVLLDDRFDSWMAHIYMWDRESYELSILFAGATCKLVDGA